MITKQFKSRNEICNDFYIYDANYVKGIPIKNRTEDEFLRTYEEIYAKLTKQRILTQLSQDQQLMLESN